MTDISNLSRRILVLEREARMWRTVLGLVLVVVAFVSLAAHAASQSRPPVRTTELQIVDAAGKTRAWFGVDETGALNLRAMDAEGKMRSVMAVNANGSAGMLLYDDKTVRALLSPTGLTFRDTSGNARVLVGTLEDGNPSITFRDPSGNVRSVVTQGVR